MKTAVCVELARFELQEGRSPTQLIAASDRLQREFLSDCPGFLKRELLHLDGSAYLDLVHWRSADDAQAAMAAAMQSSVAADYFGLMSEGTSPPLHGESICFYS
jgi:heme-degrading monooxygenase HmoA